MTNCLFLYRNMADEAVLTASSAAVDDTGAALAAANLQAAGLGKVWRSTDRSAEWIEAAFSAADGAGIDTVAILGHNATLSGEVDVTLWSDAGKTQQIYTVSTTLWPQVYGIGEAPMNETTIAGHPLPTDLDDYPPFRLIRLGAGYQARVMRLDLRDPTNGDGYLEAGRLTAGIAWQPTYNFAMGAEDWVESDDDVEDLGRGALHIERGRSWRMRRITFSDLTESEADGFLADFQRRVRLSADLLFVGNPDGKIAEWRSCIYGVVSGRPPVKRRLSPVDWGVTMTIREIVG